MTDTTWKLSGAVGDVEAEPPLFPQHMTQGIGYPLRPVDGVPPVNSGDVFAGGVVAEGLFMQFMDKGYEAGKYYAKGSVVIGEGFQMVATTFTLDYPFPVTTEAASYSKPAFTPAGVPSDESQVNSGQVFTLTSGGYVKGIRVWVPELTVDTNYRVIIADVTDPENIVTRTIEEPVLTAGQWTVIEQANTIAQAGTIWRVWLDALNSGASNQVTGGWSYEGTVNTAAPLAQGCNRNQQHTIVRVDNTDLDGTNRNSELVGVIPDTTLTIFDTGTPSKVFIYRVLSVTPVINHVEYAVVIQSIGEDGPAVGTSTVTFDIPVALPTRYSEEPSGAGTPSWGTVTGFLEFDGVDQGVPATNGYGVDIEFEPATVSQDWAIMSIT